MTNTDRIRFAEALGAVFTLYGKDLPDAVIEMWWRALEGYELAAVLEALTRHARDPDAGVYLPKPADVVRQLGGTSKDASVLAWAKVAEAVRRIGNYASVVFDDPIIHRCIEDLGGWPEVCRTTDKEWPFLENRFCAAYRAWRFRGVVPPHCSRLAGTVESTNRFNGYHEAKYPLRQIGDAHACKLISSGAMQPAPLALPERVT